MLDSGAPLPRDTVETKKRVPSPIKEPELESAPSASVQELSTAANGEAAKEQSPVPVETSGEQPPTGSNVEIEVDAEGPKANAEEMKGNVGETKDDVESTIIPATPKTQTPAESKEGAGTGLADFARTSDEEDENVVFTQDYLDERKLAFEKELQALRTEMPPPPLEDRNLVSLMMRIQLLGVLAKEEPPGLTWAESIATMAETHASKDEEEHVGLPDGVEFKGRERTPEEKIPDESRPIPITVTVEELPFLNSGPPTPISDMEVYRENTLSFDRIKDVFRRELSFRRQSTKKKNDTLRNEYLSYYKPWRLDVWELDRQKGKVASPSGPATPPGSNSTPTPTPITDGRRYKGNSELDFQLALKASEISAQEELERRRENMATAYPDLAREASIPDMLEIEQKNALVHKNFNNSVDPAKAKDVFGFIPPPDDFSAEEHSKFTDAFMAYPKKWWKIAEALPGRDFHQCIMHYYMTKEEIKYKAKLNKRWSRRGRSRRSARPKSDALMVNLGIKSDGDDEPPAVTDTGRPRRAAAPTFGESSMEVEHQHPHTTATAAPAAAGRRGNAAKESENGEKATSRRPRTGPGSRGGRRGRGLAPPASPNQQLQQQSQQQKPSSRRPVSNASNLAKTETEAMSAALARAIEEESHEGNIPSSCARSGRARAREGNMSYLESADAESGAAVSAGRQPVEAAYGSLQPTSYWSVPEQRDFPILLGHFGRDFEGISNYMKTKTAVMVSLFLLSFLFFFLAMLTGLGEKLFSKAS